MATTTTKFDPAPPHEQTLAHQSKLPKLPVPPLEETCKRYLRALEALQTPHEHEETKRAVQEFLEDPEQGPRIQKKLEEWAETKARCVPHGTQKAFSGLTSFILFSYIEDFW